MSNAKRLAGLREKLAEEGIVVKDISLTARGHYFLTLERLGETRTVTVGGTPGDWRALHNNLTQIRRSFRMPPLPRGVRAA
jgi:hypothetical protein